MRPFFESIFNFDKDTSNMAIIALAGAKELGDKIDYYLVNWYNQEAKAQGKKLHRDTFLVKNVCPRFTTGDGKGLVMETVRGKDLYILCDMGNYSITYDMFGFKNHMSPDDHYSDLKRIIAAAGGKAKSITVVMPSLYGGRQHRRNARESLDCAQMLQELVSMGVSEIITFDAHDPRVQNAVPLMGFDNFLPTYQILKAMLRSYPDLDMTKERFMIVSPDEGAMSRNIYYASVLGTDLGMFYKRRDYANVVNGRNPIVAHEYIGNDVRGKDIFVADDIIATGDSMLKLCVELKERGCGKIFFVGDVRAVHRGRAEVRGRLQSRFVHRGAQHQFDLLPARTSRKEVVHTGGHVQIRRVHHLGVRSEQVAQRTSRSARQDPRAHREIQFDKARAIDARH